MSSHRPRGGGGHQPPSYRSYPPQQQQPRDDFYDDRSRSDSPNHGQGHSSPRHPRQSPPPHDLISNPMTTGPGPAQEGFRIRGRSGRSPDRQQQYQHGYGSSRGGTTGRGPHAYSPGDGEGGRGRGRGYGLGPGSGYNYEGRRSQSPHRPRSYYDRDEPRSPSPYRPRSYHDRDDPRPPSPRRARSYHDRDDPRSSRDRDSRSRSRSRGRMRTPTEDGPRDRGKASKEIMMEGLAPHLTENDISLELKQYYHAEGLEDVRIIRDRQTKQSRGFGFICFSGLQQAEEFMDQNYPFIYLYGENEKSNGDASKVRIAFGRERKDAIRTEEPDWICPVCTINNFSTRQKCFRCQAARPDPAYEVPAKAPNLGDNDVSPDNAPSQFLLLRGLEPSVTEELLVKGVAKLNKPSSSATQRDETSGKKGAKVASTTGDANLGAKEGTLRRVLLVRDRRTNDSWRYGFAEYASIEDAQAALTRYNSFERFTIASKQVLVSYIHAGVFVPVLNPSPNTERFTFSPLGNPAMKLAYWDEAAYVTELAVFPPASSTLGTKSTAAAAAEGSSAKASKEPTEKPKKRKIQTDAETAGVVKKPAPSHLQFWSNRHAELHGISQKTGGKDGGGDDNTNTNKSSDNGDAAPPSQSYADPERRCCYLCMRQFTNNAEVNRHERLSDLHRHNLKDETKVHKAQAKLAKHGIQPNQPVISATQYRDRARERRKIYGVVNKKGEIVQPPGAQRATTTSTTTMMKSAGLGLSSDDAASAVDDPGAAAAAAVKQSKGASLLSKMGYTAGQGLGASGGGMTAPITQEVYVAGVGLGAEGGKLGDAVVEAERNTKGGYDAFAERTREGARERYARLG